MRIHRLIYFVSQPTITVANDNVADDAFGRHENKRGGAFSTVRPNAARGTFRIVPVVPRKVQLQLYEPF